MAIVSSSPTLSRLSGMTGASADTMLGPLRVPLYCKHLDSIFSGVYRIQLPLCGPAFNSALDPIIMLETLTVDSSVLTLGAVDSNIQHTAHCISREYWHDARPRLTSPCAHLGKLRPQKIPMPPRRGPRSLHVRLPR